MKTLFSFLYTAAALLLAASAVAQPALPAATYTGPRDPGGPDSLRALVFRSTLATGLKPVGRMLVQFELKPTGEPYNLTLVRPPAPLNKELVSATATALNYLEDKIPAWQTGTPPPDAKPASEPSKISLVFDFTAGAPASLPYHYADQNPIFASLPELLRARGKYYGEKVFNDPTKLAAFISSTEGLATTVQGLVLYPSEALRSQQQGTVYAYFEVAESGAIEQAAILGTAGRALDAEVLRVVRKLPAATTPALLRGQPVRVSYALPVRFVIQ